MNIFQPAKKVIIIIFIGFLLLNCPKRLDVKTAKIEVIYLSSLIDDIKNPEPYLCSIKNFKGIKVGYLHFATPFMSQIFQRLGFYNILDEVPIDFLITNQPVVGKKFLSIPVDFGYGFKNYEGIRFAILCRFRDSLTISEQIKLAMVKERSDLLWVVDKKFLYSPPKQIDFILRERVLQDTIIKKIKPEVDTLLLRTLQNFNELLTKTLQTKVSINNRSISEFIFSKLKEKYNINIMIYPFDLIKDNKAKESMTIAELLDKIYCDRKFRIQELSKTEVNKMLNQKTYAVIGNNIKSNIALIPDEGGEYLFDLLFY